MSRLFPLALAASLLTAVSLNARPSFGIIVDNVSYDKCKAEVDAYRNAVINYNGLDAFVSATDWTSPEMVRDSIRKWHSERSLEGVVFVGDIPVAMIRQAQFLTSAFKMDEDVNSNAMRDSSVPSDRFYDDFGLEFDYVGRDSVETNFFYYNLSPDGDQHIECDIYSGRIKPSADWEDKYVELSNYLSKLVAVKAETSNRLDNISSYTGEGSFSNSMIAWKDETRTLREQASEAFDNVDGARFFVFYQDAYMKEMLLKDASREESDIFLFHHHGTPERQWIGGYITDDDFDDPDREFSSYDDMYDAMYANEYELTKYQVRLLARRLARRNSEEGVYSHLLKNYGLDRSWAEGYDDPEVTTADSLLELRTGIVLSDIQAAATNSRIVLFDACYNGDFRESDNVATRYIMGKGKTVVGLGNSVNVLQDKASCTLMGMLSCGYSVGEWQQQVNILESHIIGDPTFRFESSYDFAKPVLNSEDIDAWLAYTADTYPSDIRALALHKLGGLGYEGTPALASRMYGESKEYTLRYECMMELLHYDCPESREVLLAALDDNYEFTRRKAAHFLGKRGEVSTIPALIEALFEDYNAARVEFNILRSAGEFPDSTFKVQFCKALDENDFIFDKEAFGRRCCSLIESTAGMRDYFLDIFTDKSLSARRRILFANTFRNCPDPSSVATIISMLEDDSESKDIRLCCAEMLGWFNLAWNRADIVSQLDGYLPACGDEDIANEIRKTVKRLEDYLR